MIQFKGLRCQWDPRSVVWQTVLLIVVWSYVVGLHATNDGLWYQGDAPRHAANGLFWRDFLSRVPVSPVEFAVSYYLRYPVISPSSYPPAFYLLEAAAFTVFGVTPFAAKALVLLFALGGSGYLMAWLRRWIAPEAGWAASLLLLQPGVVGWAHAIMLNIPSMALVMAALYHARSWIERSSSRDLKLTILFSVLGMLTYVHAGLVLPIAFAWLIMEKRWRIRRSVSLLVAGGAAAALVGSCVLMMSRWSPVHMSLVIPEAHQLFEVDRWLYYAYNLPRVVNASIVAFAIAGVLFGILDRRYRRDVMLLTIWFGMGYLALSSLMARDPRYLLPVIPPLIGLTVIGLAAMASLLGTERRRSLVYATALGLLVLHIAAAPRVYVTRVDGFDEIVAFVQKEAPRERVFYDGHYNGIFAFYLLAGDRQFERSMARGSKLLYPSAIDPGWHMVERVWSPADVVAVLRKECGCRWVLVERKIDVTAIGLKAVHYLRQALGGRDFEFVRSFPIHVVIDSGPPPYETEEIQVDAYRLVGPVDQGREVHLHMPILGDGVVIHGTPIER